MKFAEVAVDAPTGHDRTFSYSIPDNLNIQPGQSVKVPFGPRTLQGIVFETVPVPQVDETRDIADTISAGALLEPHQLALARWISEYYLCSLFESAALMLPPGGRFRPRTYYSLSSHVQDITSAANSPQQQRILEYIQRYEVVDASRLDRALGPNSRGIAARLAERGLLESKVRSSSRQMTHKLVEHIALNSEMLEEIGAWMPDARRRAPKQAALVEALVAANGPQLATEVRREFGASTVSTIRERQWLSITQQRTDRDPLAGQYFAPEPSVGLTTRQQSVTDAVRAGLEHPEETQQTFLVQGVTGSGKTEIYLAAVQQCLELGRRAIVMVPEIALTQQTIERFASRFPNGVAVLHSGLSAGERFDQWWKTREGDYDIVVGSRSAIFAPMPNLGLVLVDEEHEWTYKQQDPNPRYHARDVANKLAQLTGAKVLLGSASPDVSSYHRGLTKQYGLLVLPDRLSVSENGNPTPAPLADVDVVDMRQELKDGNRDMFSRQLDTEMEACLKAGNQMILFLNRRGTASQLQCRSCGHQMRCAKCDIALTYHRGAGRLVCHYCGTRRRIPDRCPQCLGYRLSYYGIGTQSVAEALEKRFPNTNILRWDRDATRNVADYRELLEKFRTGEGQALVGTQMIAKGLHFPSVTLVGVVLADVGLSIPDYRAGERGFQLLCQVAGRAGRGEQPGRVIIQTYQPDNYAIRAAAAQDYQSFYTREMAYRRERGNPPFNKLIRLLHTHVNQAMCEQEAHAVAQTLTEERDARGIGSVEILGPVPAFPTRLRGRYRWHIVLRGPEPRELLDHISLPRDWHADIDPVSLT
ncbi:MAG: primosomal protein N' [SAR202 cluster bacterium]|jgi:primosomal protein N' (replication factor Y)|nr:primosomal protein N' [SAR202 cluster bacterium]